MSLTTNTLTALSARRVLSTMAAAAMILIGGPGTARADDGAHFVPEATEASWDGSVATVAFREVDVELEDTELTTISVRVTADVDAVCRRGESILRIHRSATALEVGEYPISDEGVVEGAAEIPLKVTGLKPSGFTCEIEQVSVTAILEDFFTGATLIHKT